MAQIKNCGPDKNRSIGVRIQTNEMSVVNLYVYILYIIPFYNMKSLTIKDQNHCLSKKSIHSMASEPARKKLYMKIEYKFCDGKRKLKTKSMIGAESLKQNL